MFRSLNLAVESHRDTGPSVWERLGRAKNRDPRRLGMMVAGTVLIASAMRQRPMGRPWAATLWGICTITGCLSVGYSRPVGRLLARLGYPWIGHPDENVDRASADSFPASDPPASMK